MLYTKGWTMHRDESFQFSFCIWGILLCLLLFFLFRDWNTIMLQNCCLGVFRFSFHKQQVNLNRSTFQQPTVKWIVAYFMCVCVFESKCDTPLIRIINNFEWEWHLQTFNEIILNSHPIQVYSLKHNSSWIKFQFEINC